MTSKSQRPSKLQLMTNHLPIDLSNMVCQYSSEALDWFDNLSGFGQSKYPKDYPTLKCLDRYFIQFVKHFNDDEFFMMSESIENIKFPSVTDCLMRLIAVFYKNKKVFDTFASSIGNVFFGIEQLFEARFDDIILVHFKKCYINDLIGVVRMMNYNYVLSVIYNSSLVMRYIERHFNSSFLVLHKVYSGTIDDMMKHLHERFSHEIIILLTIP